MTRPTTQIFDAAATARLIPYAPLVDALRRASIDYAQQRIASPERLVVPLNEGGIMLSMPATAPDLAIHKLVNVCASNRTRGIPTIHGQVMAFDADTGETLFILDGPTVTGRRTAAMSMLGVHTFAPATPREFLLIGTGTQAVNHLEAIGELFPEARVWVKGSSPARAEAFCAAHAAQGARGGKARELQPLADPNAAVPDSIDVVIALTTSDQAVYDEAARADRLVIGVGAFTPAMVEIGARTIAGSALFVDDEAGARHEAGDFIQAGVDWAQVGGIAAVVDNTALLPSKQPIVFKSVGLRGVGSGGLPRGARSLVRRLIADRSQHSVRCGSEVLVGILRQPAAHVAVQTISKRCTIGVCQKKAPARRRFFALCLLT